MITNIIFARNTWCPDYTNNLGLEINCDKYKYLAIFGEERKITEGEKINPTCSLYGYQEIILTIEYLSF